MIEKIEIQNLRCSGCVTTVKKKIAETIGVLNVDVNVDLSMVIVHLESESFLEGVKRRLADIGYPSVDESNSVVQKAKSFVSCATGKMSK